MTSTKQQQYGIDVVEFYQHSEEELQQFIKKREVQYFRHCESPAYPQLGVNVQWFSEKPLTQALTELTEFLLKGYTVADALNRPLYFRVQLKKPADMIDADLVIVAQEAAEQYQADRLQRNVSETERQVAISKERFARDARIKLEKAAEKAEKAAHESALADLLKAYEKTAKTEAAA